MTRADELEKMLPCLIDAIAHQQPVLMQGYARSDIIALLPKLTEHKLESIALLSLSETAAMGPFYLDTYNTQFSTVKSRLGASLEALGCVFLQGFPRCMEHAHFYTPGMRSDIDIYVPASSYTLFCKAAMDAGFNYYGFDQNSVFVLNEDQARDMTAQQWAHKDATLSIPLEVELPELPVTIDDCYLPYVLRGGRTYLFVSVEVHHFYTDVSNVKVLEATREHWTQMGVDRCNAEGTLYFNLIRLHRGVFAGEARMRLVLDTACLFTAPARPLDLGVFGQMLRASPEREPMRAVCLALATLHPLFEPLRTFTAQQPDRHLARQWLERFFDSMRLATGDE